MDYNLIFNVLFFGIIGLAVLGGLLSGFKKSLFRFVTMLVFYAVFFLTIRSVSSFLWTVEIPQLGTWLSNIDSSLSSYTTLEQALSPTLEVLLGVNLTSTSSTMEAFILGMGGFIVKLIYTILYFTVGLILWKIICFILRLVFIHNTKGASKNSLLGAVFGFANGAMAVAVMLIMMGGFMDIVGSVSAVIPDEIPSNLASPYDRNHLYEASQSVILLAEEGESPIDMQEIKTMVEAYDQNIVVSIANSITVTNTDQVTMPFNLYLFDEVLSFEYEEETIYFRQELKVVATIFDQIFTALDEAGIDITNITEDDLGIILGAAASVDLTQLLDSKLISNALVYILSGEAGLEISDVLIVPDDIVWFDELDDDGNIIPGELRSILEALNAIIDVSGMVDFTDFNLDVIAELTSDTINTIFESQVLVATISNLILTQDFGDTEVIIPDTVFDENRYLKKTELVAMVEAIKLIIVTTTDGQDFDFTKVLSLSYDDIDTLFESEILSATVGNYVYDLSGDPIIIPSSALTTVWTDEATQSHTVVSVEELTAVLNGLSLIEFSDFDTMTFDATLIEKFESETTPGTLDDDKLSTLLSSQILHATLSKMLLDLTSGVDAVVTIPYYNQDGDLLRQMLDTTIVIDENEIIAMLKAVYSLGFTDFNELGVLDPSIIFDHLDDLLESATLHYTISDTLVSLGSSVLEIPTVDANGVPTSYTYGAGSETTTYLKESEIEAIVDGLEVFGLDDLEGFAGVIDLTKLSTETNQDRILASASLHYTISKTLLDLSDEVLIVPEYSENGVAEVNRITKTVSGYEYVSKSEIKALINSFAAMEFDDLDSFGLELTSDLFFSERATLLASSSIQATLSDKMLNDTAGLLVIPNDVRVTVGSIVYVEKTEIEAIMDGLELINLTDFDALTFDPDTLFGTDYDLLFTSQSMQATVSKPILDIAFDETAATGTTTLIVPTALRESISVGLAATEQIELNELKQLLTSLDVLGITDFVGGNFDASSITTMTEADLTTMLLSGSLHVTLDNMLDDNDNISMTEYAETDLLYGVLNLTTAEELVSFILAANQLTSGNFTDADFDYTTILGMTPENRLVVLHSMIVRFLITQELESLVALKNIAVAPAGPFFTLNAEDYESLDDVSANRVFTEADILEIFKFMNDEVFADD